MANATSIWSYDEARVKNELVVPKRISNSDFYFEAKLNANSIVKRAKDLLGLFGHNNNDLKIEIDSNTQ